jgi:general secretion pathway protein J
MTGNRGMTLIELVVAMAVFALLAIMGVQALTGTLRLRDRLTGIESGTAELSLASTLLRHDLTAMIPMLFFPPGARPRSSLDLSADGQMLGLSVGGQLDLPPVLGLGLHRVEWRWDPAQQILSRRAWPVLSPVNASAALPAVPVLTGVTGFGVRSYWFDQGWVSGTDSAVLQSAEAVGLDSDRGLVVTESYSDSLPLAVEVTIETTEFGQITLVESLK